MSQLLLGGLDLYLRRTVLLLLTNVIGLEQNRMLANDWHYDVMLLWITHTFAHGTSNLTKEYSWMVSFTRIK